MFSIIFWISLEGAFKCALSDEKEEKIKKNTHPNTHPNMIMDEHRRETNRAKMHVLLFEPKILNFRLAGEKEK